MTQGTQQIREHTNWRPLSILLGSVGLFIAMLGPAFAGINDDAAKCRQEIMKNPIAADSHLKFKGARGGRMQQLRFEMTKEDDKQSIICKVSRGRVVEIVWPS